MFVVVVWEVEVFVVVVIANLVLVGAWRLGSLVVWVLMDVFALGVDVVVVVVFWKVEVLVVVVGLGLDVVVGCGLEVVVVLVLVEVFVRGLDVVVVVVVREVEGVVVVAVVVHPFSSPPFARSSFPTSSVCMTVVVWGPRR